MADTVFVDGVTLTAAAWFNDINLAVYEGIGIAGISTVASAASPDIFAATVSGVISYTGTATATSFVAAPKVGARRTLNCTAAAVFTASANMIIPGITAASNFTAAANTRIEVVAITLTQFQLNVLKADGTAVSTSVIRSYLAGLTMSTAGASTTMSVAAGVAADSTNTAMMTLAAIAKTTSAWAVGTAQGGLDTGAIANSTWYYWYETQRPDTGVVDIIFSLSASVPAYPANYTLSRRIGAGLTNGSAQWTSFVQDGDYFRWAASVLDVNANNSGTAAVTRTLTVPRLNVVALMNVLIVNNDTGAFESIVLSDLAANDEAPSLTVTPLSSAIMIGAAAATNRASGQASVRTNTSAQIRSRQMLGSVNSTLFIATYGWIDQMGKNA